MYYKCIIIIISIFFLLLFPYNQIEQFNNHIPKIIWAYWDKQNLPEFIKICQKNWKKFARHYKIHLLHKQNIENWINMPDNWQTLPPYRQSDIIRLKLLEKYGGIWMDASIILLTNPDNFIEGDLTLFTTPGTKLDNPVYENWFIASSKNNPIIKKWLKEVLLALKNKELYIKNSSNENKILVDNVNYLICHLCLRNIYEKNPKLFTNGKYYESKSTAFYEHYKHNWKNIGENIFKNFTINPNRLMIKLRRRDRKNIKNIPLELY